ncbi:MAG TPA: HEAT repeat domain-containing protein [Sedimentisphaerales bacterium]|nr:HEAT repeat domain-containing protein [Sedimentisphaerales bacterium]
MNMLSDTKKYLSGVCVVLLFVFLCLCSSAAGSPTKFNFAAELNRNGYPTDTTEQIIEATQSKSYPMRYCALTLLTERVGKEAIPELRKALNDEQMEVRWRAAHLLGTLGDKGGLDKMREDLEQFAPNSGAAAPPDPNAQDQNQVPESEQKRNLRLYYGLHAAKVLAELGDRRGYQLAARMALGGEWAAQRSEAIRVLVEIAKTEKATLAKEKMDPVSVLCAVARSEKVRSVYGTLASSAEQLGGDAGIQILESAMNSPHQSQETLDVTKLRLEKVKAKIEAAKKKK